MVDPRFAYKLGALIYDAAVSFANWVMSLF